MPLRRLNIAACVLHSILTILVAVVFLSSDDQREKGVLQVYRLGTDPLPTNKGPDAAKTLEKTTTINLTWLLILFCLVTAVAHAFYAYGSETWYDRLISKGAMKWRWVEYGISATFMLLIVSSLSGARVFSFLFTATFSSIAMMACGAVSEQATADGKSLADPRVWWPLLAGWCNFLGTWVSIGLVFFSGIKDANDSDDPNVDSAPSWLWAIYLSQLVFFTSFGAVSLYNAWKRPPFLIIERWYIILSFAAKATLVGLMVGGLGAT